MISERGAQNYNWYPLVCTQSRNLKGLKVSSISEEPHKHHVNYCERLGEHSNELVYILLDLGDVHLSRNRPGY